VTTTVLATGLGAAWLVARDWTVSLPAAEAEHQSAMNSSIVRPASLSKLDRKPFFSVRPP
jgi:hypothetical protein